MELAIAITCLILLAVIVIGLLVWLHLYVRQTNEQISKFTKAILSRNMNDYIAATVAEKPDRAQPNAESDEVLLSDASDEVFDKFIQRQTS